MSPGSPAGEFSRRADAPALGLAADGAGGGAVGGAVGVPVGPQNKNRNLLEASSDEDLDRVLRQAKASKRPVVLSYGAAWCHACHKMLPTFFNLSNEYARPLFVYADVDKCAKLSETIRYTPTFEFYRDGDKVDEFYGAGVQRLRDRVWLQA